MSRASVNVELKGFRELSAGLGDLTTRMGDAATRKAVRAGAKPVVAQAKANLAALPLVDSTGLLRRSVGLQSLKKYRPRRRTGPAPRSATEARIQNAGGVFVAKVGARRGFKALVQRRNPYASKAALTAPLIHANAGTTRGVWSDPANYAHLIELGVRPHPIGKGARLSRIGQAFSTQRLNGAIHPGFAAKPWLQPALDAQRGNATEIIAQTFRSALAQEAARLRAKVNAGKRVAA